MHIFHIFGSTLLSLCFFRTFSYQGTSSFEKVSLTVNSNSTKTPFDFTVSFRTIREIYHNEFIVVSLPRFTSQLIDFNITRNVSLGDLIISPSYYFHAAWVEGTPHFQKSDSTYLTSQLFIQTKGNWTIPSYTYIDVTVYKENGIGAICGFASSSVYNNSMGRIRPFRPFRINTLTQHVITDIRTLTKLDYTYDPITAEELSVTPITYNETYAVRNTTYLNNDTYILDSYSGVGNGCETLLHCLGRGECDYCHETCHCFSGYGADTDIITHGRDLQPDCSARVCPAGKAIGDVPRDSQNAHELAECSNMGKCNRLTGQCECFEPFTGSACEKLACPNDCSGHGRCVSMADMAKMVELDEPNNYPVEYGSGGGLSTIAWDHHTMYGCVCDSGWRVGYFAGERQLSEYFGPDCSLRHCPSGDDPYTSVNEEDCMRINQQQDGGPQRGKANSKCHIDCSNRGVCNYNTGQCSCFDGSWGDACDQIANAGRHSLYGGANVDTFAEANVNDSIIIEGN